MYGQREYEAESVVAGPSFNLVIGKINLVYEQDQSTNRKKSKQKWHLQEPLIMPGETRFNDYPPSTLDTVEKIRRDLRRILLRKGTLANLFTKDEGQPRDKRDQDVRMRGKKRDAGYSQFY